MKKYSAFQIPFLSFFSKGLYRDVCFNRKGTGFGYLFVLMLVIGIPLMIEAQLEFSRACRESAPKIISQFPQINFDHGEASVLAPQPCIITDPQTHKALVIIDTTGRFTSLQGTDAFILVTKKEAILKKNEVQSSTFNYSKLGTYELTQDKLRGWVETIRKFAGIGLYTFLVIGFYVYRGVQLLVYSAVAMLIASWVKLRQPYKAVLRLTSVAMTPGILIGAVLSMVPIHMPGMGLLFVVLTLSYLFFGIRECSRDFSFGEVRDPEPPAADIPHNPGNSGDGEWF